MRIQLTRDLTQPRLAAEQEIDTFTEGMRQLVITPGSGQALVYDTKLTEALAFLAGSPVSELPHLRLEAEMRGISYSDQADLYITLNQRWVEASARLEVLRLKGKMLVEECQTPAEIQLVVTQTKDLITGVLNGA